MQCLLIVIIAIALFLCACIVLIEVRAYQRKARENEAARDELEQFNDAGEWDSDSPWSDTHSGEQK